MSQLVAGSQRQKAAAAKAVVARYIPQMRAMVPGQSMDADHLLAYAHLAISNEPKLALCTGHSLVSSVLESVALGLPIGVLGQCWLIPFKDKATLIIGYRGLIELAMRSNRVSAVDAFVVREGDEFEWQLGTNAGIHHRRKPGTKYGEVVAAYALLRHKDGTVQFEVMERDDLERVRRVSKMRDSGAWRDHPEEMYRKCPIRRLLKRVPVSTLSTRAADLDERNELGLSGRSLSEEQVLLPDTVAAAQLATEEEVQAALEGKLPGQGLPDSPEEPQQGAEEDDRPVQGNLEGRGDTPTACSHPDCDEPALVAGQGCERHWEGG